MTSNTAQLTSTQSGASSCGVALSVTSRDRHRVVPSTGQCLDTAIVGVRHALIYLAIRVLEHGGVMICSIAANPANRSDVGQAVYAAGHFSGCTWFLMFRKKRN